MAALSAVALMGVMLGAAGAGATGVAVGAAVALLGLAVVLIGRPD